MTRAAKTFARRLREERQRVGLSQAALAERLSGLLEHTVHPTAVALAEKNGRAVRLDEAVALAEVFDMPLSALLRDREAIDEQIDDLRQELSQHVWQASQAKGDLERAQVSIEATERAIAELEASRGD